MRNATNEIQQNIFTFFFEFFTLSLSALLSFFRQFDSSFRFTLQFCWLHFIVLIFYAAVAVTLQPNTKSLFDWKMNFRLKSN